MVLLRPSIRLLTDLAALGDVLQGLELTLSDRPQTDGDALADRLADVATELVAGIEEARHLASDVATSDLPRLARLNELLLRTAHLFHDAFAAPAQARELARMGQRRRGEWPAWTVAVAGAVEQVWPMLFNAQEAVRDCLSDLSLRLAHPSPH